MKLKTRVFKLCNGKYESLSELARAMGISLTQVYRVLAGKCDIGEKFIIGAVKAFPGYKLDDLFYVPDGSEMTDSGSDGAKGNLVSTQQPPEARRDEIVKLRKAGQTYLKIGERFGISKERVRQILKEISVPKKPSLEFDIMLTAGEAARMLGVHENTVRRWSKKGILKSCRVGPRGDRRFRRQDVDSFLVRIL